MHHSCDWCIEYRTVLSEAFPAIDPCMLLVTFSSSIINIIKFKKKYFTRPKMNQREKPETRLEGAAIALQAKNLGTEM